MLKKLFVVTPLLALAVSGFIGISIFLAATIQEQIDGGFFG